MYYSKQTIILVEGLRLHNAIMRYGPFFIIVFKYICHLVEALFKLWYELPDVEFGISFWLKHSN